MEGDKIPEGVVVDDMAVWLLFVSTEIQGKLAHDGGRTGGRLGQRGTQG